MTIQWLVCREPVHIGGADSSTRGNNNPIYRLSDRTPAIPGSSLRGALREHAEETLESSLVKDWFGGKDEDISPGAISLGWGWPLWWPVNVLGYGNWWITCPSWINRFQTLSGDSPINFSQPDQVYTTEPELNGKTVYLRWLKLTNVQHEERALSAPSDVPANRRIIVPDESINLFVDMGLVRQPRVKLLDEPDENGNLVSNLFGVEGLPPGAVFLMNWTVRGKVQKQEEWEDFLQGEHYLGGLWSVGYGRIAISNIGE
jgi:CRISPR/Cas system CMR subunit Cmr4 (Cas7 group RAMP superfamily)